MPRIPDALSQSVAFLFPSEDKAESNAPGGTGFFVRDERERVSLVTNIHVAANCNFAKINSQQGPRIIALDGAKWVSHPQGDDVALQIVSPEDDWQVSPLSLSQLLATDTRMEELNAGIGDEVFMLGRFVSHRGLSSVRPMARFGNIAMMPGEPVLDGRNLKVEAFLIEMRSLSGFSGSPVFIHLGPGTYRGNGTMMPFYSETIGLIGIDSGHSELRSKVFDRGGEATDFSVRQNTCISIVVPYSKIRELIDIA